MMQSYDNFPNPPRLSKKIGGFFTVEQKEDNLDNSDNIYLTTVENRVTAQSSEKEGQKLP